MTDPTHEREAARMRAWIAEHGKDPRLLEWLRDNPLPAEWRGTPEEYAYTEMPAWVLWGW